MEGIEDKILDEFLRRYPKPLDKYDRQAKKFDYYDMLEFGEIVAKIVSNEKLDEASDKARLLISNYKGEHEDEEVDLDNYTDVKVSKESILKLKFNI